MALLQLVIHKKLFINHCKYDKLYLITIFISSEIDGRRIYVRMKTTTMSEQMGIWFIATQKKIFRYDLKLCIVHQIQLNYFRCCLRNSSCSIFDMFQWEFLCFSRVMTYWMKFSSSSQSRNFSSDNKRKMSIEWRKMCRNQQFRIIEFCSCRGQRRRRRKIRSK